jgi:ferric-dicitrate binding protein FerR (iron transport regulator)
MKFVDSEIMEKYLAGKASAEEEHKVLMWLMLNLKSPSANDDFASLLDRVPRSDDRLRKERVKNRLHQIVSDTSVRKPLRRFSGAILGTLLSAACCVIICLLVGITRLKDEMNQTVNWTEVATSYGEKQSVTLADGSVIWLNNDSKLIYPDSFRGGQRQVFVSGEVFAEITKDQKHPFIVSSDSVNVVVRGTTFNFRSYKDMRSVELTLVQGSVDLDCITRRGRRTMAVIPGETVTVDMISGKVGKYMCKTDGYVSWKDRRALYFNDLTLEEIAFELQREYGKKIVIADKHLARTRHFASFVNNETLDEVLKALCTHSGMKVEENDSIITITN